jgi:hypothetical protein
MRQPEHHTGIPLGAPQPAKTLLHVRETAPVVEIRSLAAYESVGRCRRCAMIEQLRDSLAVLSLSAVEARLGGRYRS